MKKRFNLLGIIAVIAIIIGLTAFASSCEIIKGGTITVFNNTDSQITVSISDPGNTVLYKDNVVEARGKRAFTVEEDGKHKVTSGSTTKIADVFNGSNEYVNFP